MRILETNIKDLKVLVPTEYTDERGVFFETFRDDWFCKNVSNVRFVQENHSKSIKGTLRGLHYQICNPQGKLVRVASGKVFDIAVDMRRNSKTFGKHFGLVLSCENKKQLWVPAGFAHGFYVISDYADFVYKCTDYYSPNDERSVLWSDDYLSINWPITTTKPLVSSKDKKAPIFKKAEFFKEK
ncbi:dTDP-4-dehydrorhamnose 3,5-epimerase [Gammaproteobacteria bacterium]|nr:dTDP-4-dehydrorhamnose 3,5-epimerase [Gammaproteobacteria bacterium]